MCNNFQAKSLLREWLELIPVRLEFRLFITDGSPYPIRVYYLHAQEERGRKVRLQGFCRDCFSGDTDAYGSATITKG
jgi:hypothetical protein